MNQTFPKFEKSKKLDIRKEILKLLNRGDKTPDDLLKELELKEDKRSKIAYHLKGLLKENKIEKKRGAVYHKIQIPPKPLEQEILIILESDECKEKDFQQIFDILKIKGMNISEGELIESLTTLKISDQIHKFSNYYYIASWKLNNFNRCAVCRKKFENNQLIISQYSAVDNIISNSLIHATCRYMDGIYDDSSLNCDYCGLSLNANQIILRESNKINIDNEINMLFGNIFSKIFSTINSDDHEQEGYQIAGYAHFERKNGKKYHHYCSKIVEDQNAK
ncbi:MAG: winged helix-turn-helix transcriptional regulator [Nitrosopumilus sp.]|nr:winged helix-turn-helix transcriptional regulator [Nitrosopumilus sp.]